MLNIKNKVYTTRQLDNRMQNYYQKNGRYSPLNTLEYAFLKCLYAYLTKQVMSKEYRDNLYSSYTSLINIGYKFNREDLNINTINIIYSQCKLILRNEGSGPKTFILLNSSEHHLKMNRILDMIYSWSINPLYYDYADEDQFWEAMDFMRKEFNQSKISMYDAVGKWPRKFRTRFKRKY